MKKRKAKNLIKLEQKAAPGKKATTFYLLEKLLFLIQNSLSFRVFFSNIK
jgi:hypothetical protein